MRARTSTDGTVPLRAGFPTATVVSVNEFKSIDNYHWPTDVPDNVNLDTVEQALTLAEGVVRELSD
jgi:Iap family predicted aminopeptidase